MQKNYIEQKELYNMIENYINILLADPKYHFKLENAKKEKWFGVANFINDRVGLLGYYRTNFGCQIIILNNLGNAFGIPQIHNCFLPFFRSQWFKDQTLKNNYVSNNLCKKWHFDVIKNQDYYRAEDYYMKLEN